jgi:hypothetical protein
MPFVDIYGSDKDWARIHYTTNTPLGNVSAFDPNKRTILLLSQLFLDSQWLQYQFDDHRLDSAYNMIAIDRRFTGKSLSRPSPQYDLWVEVADIAFVHQVFQNPLFLTKRY